MLHQVVESLLVSSDSQVFLDFFLFIFELVVVEIIQHLDGVGASLARLPVDLGLSCLFIGGELALGLEVLALGGRSTEDLTLGTEAVGGASHLDGRLVSALEDLKTHLGVEVSKILGLKRDVDGVLSIGQKLATSRRGSELGHLGEVKVKGQVFALVSDGENHIATLIARTLAKFERLTVDFDLGVLGAGHHLNFEVRMLNSNLVILVETDDSKGGVVSGLDSIAALVDGEARLTGC